MVKPVIVAANYVPGGRVSYPYLYERKPGELWITTMQGGLRMKSQHRRSRAGEIPVFVPPPKAQPKPGGIVMFGDSTTAPRGSVKVYATRVETALQSIGSSLRCSQRGHPQQHHRPGRKRLQEDVLRHKPRVVVMQFGINDSRRGCVEKPPMTEPRVSLEGFIANYRAMITETQKQGAKVILMTTNPLRWTSKLRELYGKPPYNADAEDGFEALNLTRYNDALRKLAGELKVPLVDVHAAYPAFAAKNKTTIEAMLPDGMHPGDLGHQLVAELLHPRINQGR
jgi:lysophospholipase L1-like esterase